MQLHDNDGGSNELSIYGLVLRFLLRMNPRNKYVLYVNVVFVFIYSLRCGRALTGFLE